MTRLFLFFILSLFSTLSADSKGKFDAGIAHIDIDIIQSGSTVRDLNLWGGSANGTWVFYKCFCLKSSTVIAYGNDDSRYRQGGAALGIVLPLGDKLYLTPNGGASYSQLKFEFMPSVNQEFRTWTKFGACDLTICISSKFMWSGSFQYGWSSSKTTIGNFLNTKTESKGINWTTILDYYLNDCWSVNIAAAGQKSKSKEKNGNEALAFRLGLGYTL